jgi:branched-chain amino acid transport system substrate-binding protein
MAELPRGTVTFLFTDIEGSTVLLRSLGDRYGNEVLATHRSILRAACARYGGHEIDAQGDATFVAFATANDALRAAIDGQEALEAHPWPDGAAVRVRIGLHTAEPVLSDGAYVGLGVHRAARICAAARGGQIVVSSATRSVLVERGAPGLTLRDLGSRRLKGLGERDRLYAATRDPSPKPTPSQSRRRAALVAAAAALLLAAGAIAALLLPGGGTPPRALVPGGAVGAIDPARQVLIGTAPVAGAPDRLAVAGGAVWSVSDASGALAEIDVRRRTVTTVVPSGGAPRDVAAGLGAIWTIDERGGRLLEISPAYQRVVHRFALARPPGSSEVRAVGSFDAWSLGVGAGAVWVSDGSSRLTRVDPRTGRRTRIDVARPLDGVTVADGAVWAISGRRAEVVRIDPGGGRVTDRISIVSRPGPASRYPIAIEGGLGSLWVLNANDATLTRIDPLQRVVARTSRIGLVHVPVRMAVGAGAVWIAGVDGTLSRVDPRTGSVTTTAVARRIYDVAVAGGAVWVSADHGLGAPFGAPPAAPSGARSSVMALPASSCSPPYYRRGDRPRLLIASDFPLQAPDPLQGLQITDAIRFVLARRGFRAGRYPVAYQACDDSTPTPEATFLARCAPNARAYARDPSLVAVVGDFYSDCTRLEVPILNRAPGGPIAQISPASTYVGLTGGGPGAAPGEPARYAPSGRRSFLRVIARDDVQGAADAELAKTLGVRRPYVLEDGSGYGRGIADAFDRAAGRLGIRSVGRAAFSPRPELATRVRASGADGVFMAGNILPFGPRIITSLRRALPAGARLLAPDGFATPDLLRRVGPAAEGLTVSVAGVPVARLPRAGVRFVDQFGATIGERVDPFAVHAAQATEVLLDAIARSDGTRASILRALFATRVQNGILGNFAFNSDGDITAGAVTIFRLTQGQLRVAQVISPPARLLRG